MPQPSYPPPPRRSAAFAAAVRRRVQPRPEPRLGGGWAVGGTGPAAAEQVLRLTARPWVVHQHRHDGTRLGLRVNLATTLGGWRRELRQTIWRTTTTRSAGTQPSARTRATSSPTPERPAARIEWLAANATTTGASPAPQSALSPPAAPTRFHRPGPAALHEVAPIEQTHRSPSPRPAGTQQALPPTPPPPLSVPWNGEPVRPSADPLTAADLPTVIDQVVGELDRRVTAARERRGWTA